MGLRVRVFCRVEDAARNVHHVGVVARIIAIANRVGIVVRYRSGGRRRGTGNVGLRATIVIELLALPTTLWMRGETEGYATDTEMRSVAGFLFRREGMPAGLQF